MANFQGKEVEKAREGSLSLTKLWGICKYLPILRGCVIQPEQRQFNLNKDSTKGPKQNLNSEIVPALFSKREKHHEKSIFKTGKKTPDGF